MALTEEERSVILSLAKNIILEDFQKEFQEIYAYAVTALDKVPEQINNEISNSLTHIARALDADNTDDAHKALIQAQGHIERARRDCLKLAIIDLHEKIKSDFINIELNEGAVPVSLKLCAQTLEKQAIRAREAESKGDSRTADNLAGIFAGYKIFRDDIHLTFALPSKKLTKLEMLFLKIKRNAGLVIFTLGTGIIAGIAATVIAYPLVKYIFENE